MKKYMKKILFVLMALLTTFVMSAAAQTEDWLMYALDSVNHRVVRVNTNYETSIYELAVPEEAFVSTSLMNVSDDGRYIAYCWGTTGGEAGNAYHFRVEDMQTESTVLEQDFGDIVTCSASGFTGDASRVFVSSVTSSPVYNAEETEARWSLAVYDMTDGSVIAELTEASGISSAFEDFGSDAPVLAEIREIEGTSVTFSAIPYVGVGGINVVPAFTWDWTSDSLSEAAPYYGRLSGDVLPPADEVVFPALDESREAAQPGGPMPQRNEVRIADEGGERVIYRNSDWVIVRTTFVDDGERVAVLLVENFEPQTENEVGLAQRIDLISRDGSVQTLEGRYESFVRTANIDDGLLILWSDNQVDGAPTAHLDILRDGNRMSDVWQYQPPSSQQSFSYLELLWTPPPAPESELQPFQTQASEG